MWMMTIDVNTINIIASHLSLPLASNLSCLQEIDAGLGSALCRRGGYEDIGNTSAMLPEYTRWTFRFPSTVRVFSVPVCYFVLKRRLVQIKILEGTRRKIATVTYRGSSQTVYMRMYDTSYNVLEVL